MRASPFVLVSTNKVELISVGDAFAPPLTSREHRAVDEMLDALAASVRRRLPITLELVEVELELRRSGVLPMPEPSSGGHRRTGRS